MNPQVLFGLALCKRIITFGWGRSNHRIHEDTVEASKLKADRPLIPKQKQDGEPAYITLHPHLSFTESTVEWKGSSLTGPVGLGRLPLPGRQISI